jgi:hypothetical protein
LIFSLSATALDIILHLHNDCSNHAVKAGSSPPYVTRVVHTNITQAASTLENLKFKDSPVKKIDFTSEDKENMPATATATAPSPVEVDLKKSESKVEPSEVKEVVKAAPTIQELEAEEPLLQENPHRFVLFPLKYHEIWQSKSHQYTRRVPELTRLHSVQES